MDALTKKSVRISTDVRDAILEIRAISAPFWKRGPIYRVDRLDAGQYFGILPEFRRKIDRYFQELRKKGERIVYVDICGRAMGGYIGADKSYSFSLQPVDPWFSRLAGEAVRVQGDIFSMKDFYTFIKVLKDAEDFPAFVTFEPVAGLQDYIPRRGSTYRSKLNYEVTFQRLENNLRRMIGILRPGGFILLSHPFQFSNIRDFLRRVPQEQYESSLYIKALCKELRCSVEITPTICGPSWLIRKKIKPGRHRSSRL